MFISLPGGSVTCHSIYPYVRLFWIDYHAAGPADTYGRNC